MTILDNLDHLHTSAYQMLLPEQSRIAAGRIQQVKTALELSPKSWQWRLRSLIGKRLPWYEVAEEFHPLHSSSV